MLEVYNQLDQVPQLFFFSFHVVESEFFRGNLIRGSLLGYLWPRPGLLGRPRDIRLELSAFAASHLKAGRGCPRVTGLPVQHTRLHTASVPAGRPPSRGCRAFRKSLRRGTLSVGGYHSSRVSALTSYLGWEEGVDINALQQWSSALLRSTQ